MELVNWLSYPNDEEDDHEIKQLVVADESRELPQDVIHEILSWVPLDSINRSCRRVCKDWNKLSYHWEFRKLHLQRTRTISGYFVQTKSMSHSIFISKINQYSPAIPSPTLDFLPSSKHQLHIVASSKSGLLCCVNPRRPVPHYYVCKPTTREWKQIPNPRTRFWETEMGMVVKESNPLHYKIVRFSERRRLSRSGFHCEIFDSNIGMWKRTNDVELPGYVSFLGKGPGVLINNATFHWLLCYDSEEIFAFNIDTESWRMISLPEETVKKKKGVKKLEEYKGKLGLMYFEDEFLEIWVMEEKEVWEMKKRVNLEVFRELAATTYSIPLSLYDSRIVLMLGSFDASWFDYKSNSVSTMRLSHDGICNIYKVFPFESDLVPCKLGL